jgi:uncharacterized RDD family membrane protein YckC
MTEVVTGEAVVLDVPCARFPSRMLAIIIDMTVQVIMLVVLFVIIGATGTHMNAASLAALVVTAMVLIIVGYPAAFETLSRGRSLGKLALGLRVVGDDGGPERFRQALVRALASIIEIWGLTGAPALICSLLSAKGKRIGDLFAGTFVIQERLPRRRGLPPMLAVIPPPLVGWAQALELSGLDDHTAEQASSYLRRFYELAPAARDEFGQRIAAAVAAKVTPPPPPGTPPVAFLAAVLAVRRQREAARLAAMQASAAGQRPGWSAGPAGPGGPPSSMPAGQYAPAQPPPPPAWSPQPAQPPPTWPPPPAQPASTWSAPPGQPAPTWPAPPAQPAPTWPTPSSPAALPPGQPEPPRQDAPGQPAPDRQDVPGQPAPDRPEPPDSGGFAPPA